jgi:hypothetical protein
MGRSRPPRTCVLPVFSARKGVPIRDFFSCSTPFCWSAGVCGGFAGNQPATIASRNRRNSHVMLLLDRDSIVTACGHNRRWAGGSLSDPRDSMGNDPARIALKNCRNIHGLVPLGRDSILATGCNDYGRWEFGDLRATPTAHRGRRIMRPLYILVQILGSVKRVRLADPRRDEDRVRESKPAESDGEIGHEGVVAIQRVGVFSSGS